MEHINKYMSQHYFLGITSSFTFPQLSWYSGDIFHGLNDSEPGVGLLSCFYVYHINKCKLCRTCCPRTPL